MAADNKPFTTEKDTMTVGELLQALKKYKESAPVRLFLKGHTYAPPVIRLTHHDACLYLTDDGKWDPIIGTSESSPVLKRPKKKEPSNLLPLTKEDY